MAVKKIGKTATKVTVTNGTISVVYHNTLVVEVRDNTVVLDTGGWFTAITKARMNQTAAQFGLPFRVNQKTGKWSVRVAEYGDWSSNPRVIPFEGNSVEFQIVRDHTPTATSLAKFAARINPRNLGFSPKMSAIVGAILGHDYGVRDRKGGHLTSLSITSDGFVIAASTASDGGGALLCDADELERNLEQYRFVLASEGSDEDAEEFQRIYTVRVKDWRD